MAMHMDREDNTMGPTMAVVAGLVVVLLVLYAFGAFDMTTPTAPENGSAYPNATNPNTTDPNSTTYPNATNPNAPAQQN